jgi:sulfite oxidase
LPLRLLEHMAVGRLRASDQDDIDAQMAVLEETDPYAREPHRHPSLKIHSDTPMNAEVPAHLLTQSYLTPNDLFYIRHHHPVPYLTASQLASYRLAVDIGNGNLQYYTLHDLQSKFPRRMVTVTLQCSGNRRGGYNAFQRTSGTPWGTCEKVCTRPPQYDTSTVPLT